MVACLKMESFDCLLMLNAHFLPFLVTGFLSHCLLSVELVIAFCHKVRLLSEYVENFLVYWFFIACAWALSIKNYFIARMTADI